MFLFFRVFFKLITLTTKTIFSAFTLALIIFQGRIELVKYSDKALGKTLKSNVLRYLFEEQTLKKNPT